MWTRLEPKLKKQLYTPKVPGLIIYALIIREFMSNIGQSQKKKRVHFDEEIELKRTYF